MKELVSDVSTGNLWVVCHGRRVGINDFALAYGGEARFNLLKQQSFAVTTAFVELFPLVQIRQLAQVYTWIGGDLNYIETYLQAQRAELEKRALYRGQVIDPDSVTLHVDIERDDDGERLLIRMNAFCW